MADKPRPEVSEFLRKGSNTLLDFVKFSQTYKMLTHTIIMSKQIWQKLKRKKVRFFWILNNQGLKIQELCSNRLFQIILIYYQKKRDSNKSKPLCDSIEIFTPTRKKQKRMKMKKMMKNRIKNMHRMSGIQILNTSSNLQILLLKSRLRKLIKSAEQSQQGLSRKRKLNIKFDFLKFLVIFYFRIALKFLNYLKNKRKTAKWSYIFYGKDSFRQLILKPLTKSMRNKKSQKKIYKICENKANTYFC